MASEHTNRNNTNPKVDSGTVSTADKSNIASLKAAIAVQARLVAELRNELERLKTDRVKTNNGNKVKSPTR